MFLSLSYFSTFFLKYSSADQLFLSPQIQTCWSTRKGHVIVIDVLDSSLDLSSYAFFRTVVFGGMIFSILWYSRFVKICRFRRVMSTFTLVLLERAFCACFLSWSCWYLDFDTVLTVDPFTIFKLYLLSVDFHFSYFFVIWFRARTRVRWIAHVISEFLLW